MTIPTTIFDRRLYKTQQEFSKKVIAEHDFLYREVSTRLLDKIHPLKNGFDSSLAYGFCDLSAEELNSKKHFKAFITPSPDYDFCYDEEAITLGDHKFDLIISFFSLHYCNDLLGSLQQYHKHLNEGGIFVSVIFGQNSLHELRAALKNTDLKMKGGLAARVIPMIDMKDTARLLQNAGFKMPIADVETIQAEYKSLSSLHDDLKGMGQGNCLNRKNNLYPGKDYFKLAEKEYFDLMNDKICLTATFDVITFLGKK